MVMPQKSPYVIVLKPKERESLEKISRAYSLPYRDVMRAKIILLAAEGFSNDIIASRLDMPRQIVSKWRKRFFQERKSGLQDRLRKGHPTVFPPSGDGRSKSLGL